MLEIPQYGLRAYALLYSKYSLKERFTQSCLDWIVSPSMRKKIFAVLLKAGWIKKISWQEYQCVDPDMIFQHLLDFKVPEIIKETKSPMLLQAYRRLKSGVIIVISNEEKKNHLIL